MSRRVAVLAPLGLIAALVLARGGERAAAVRYERDVVYGKGGGVELKLDLALPPAGDGPFPAVVCFHGGGWRMGKRQDLNGAIDVLAKNGFVAATVTYRLAPAHKFPAQIEDCKAAVRWLRANAKKYRIDPERIGATGASAGGHLACLLGTADKSAGLEGDGGNAEFSSRVQAVVSFFGPTDLTVKSWSKPVEDAFLVPFLGGTLEEKGDLYKLWSPITHVSKDDPPCLFFHGDKDTLVGLDQSEKLAKALNAVGVSARVVTMKGEGHGWGGEKLKQTLNEMAAFFKEKLKK
jgi:acetyl esterase/lipase